MLKEPDTDQMRIGMQHRRKGEQTMNKINIYIDMDGVQAVYGKNRRSGVRISAAERT